MTPAELVARLCSYDSEFTRWWNPRFESFGFPASPGETLLAWSDDARSVRLLRLTERRDFGFGGIQGGAVRSAAGGATRGGPVTRRR